MGGSDVFSFGNGTHSIATLSSLRGHNPFVPPSDNFDGRCDFETELLPGFELRTHGVPIYTQ